MKKLLTVTVAAGVLIAALTAAPKQAQAHTDFSLSLGFLSPPVVYAPPPPPRVIYRPQPVYYYYNPWSYYGYYHRDRDWDRNHHWDHHDRDHNWDHRHH